MRRLAFASAAAVLLLAACGGSDESSEGPGASATVASAPTSPPAGEVLPAKPQDGTMIFELWFGSEVLGITLGEFKTFPTATVTVDGRQVTGVPLSYLVERIKAAAAPSVSAQGYRPDLSRLGTFRLPIQDMTETVLYVDPDGYVSITGPKIPAQDRLRALIQIRFP